ncbi:PQQ-dependent sugar dehydrogenase [Amycolatopsis nigrescens]|uniref:PQQ-dependent sugar dehydrogenase n=1 Tax=Amycolatopsis nigrescens TaxID=381445 RepID=UPI000379B25A|nr:PQQ-dependent sugar dehydrogenase [Amycolatopsis nigrescens]
MRTRCHRTSRRPLALLAAGALLLTSCASFEDRGTGQTFAPAPQLTPQAGPEPRLPGEDGGVADRPPSSRAPQTSIPPPQGCTDFDRAVIETCLDTVSSVAALPGSASEPSALAGERRSGRLLRVAPDSDPTELAKIEVDASGDGGLTAIALSPSYAEDQLVFAYITTATDNRVVRIAPGEPPKPVLTGIPKGASGNHGALLGDGKGALLVATGDAGDPANAARADSLAGKVLRIDTAGKPAADNPVASSPVLASGLHTPGGLCKSSDGSRLWVTDRTPDKDLLFRIQPGTSLALPTWTWPDKPGLAGCADGESQLVINAATAGNMQSLPITPDGSVGGKPSVSMDGKNGPSYGRLAGLDPIDDKLAFAGTVNKDGGQPVSSDDRVVVVQRQPSPGGGGKD